MIRWIRKLLWQEYRDVDYYRVRVVQDAPGNIYIEKQYGQSKWEPCDRNGYYVKSYDPPARYPSFDEAWKRAKEIKENLNYNYNAGKRRAHNLEKERLFHGYVKEVR